MDSTLCKRLRGAMGWTRNELAEKTGLHINTISLYEDNRRATEETGSKIESAFLATGRLKIFDNGSFKYFEADK